GVHGEAGSGSGLLDRPASAIAKVARKAFKVHFFLPRARPVLVKSWSCRSWFGQWSPDPLGPCDQRSPSPQPSARPVLAVEPERREKEEVGEGRPSPWG